MLRAHVLLYFVLFRRTSRYTIYYSYSCLRIFSRTRIHLRSCVIVLAYLFHDFMTPLFLSGVRFHFVPSKDSLAFGIKCALVFLHELGVGKREVAKTFDESPSHTLPKKIGALGKNSPDSSPLPFPHQNSSIFDISICYCCS